MAKKKTTSKHPPRPPKTKTASKKSPSLDQLANVVVRTSTVPDLDDLFAAGRGPAWDRLVAALVSPTHPIYSNAKSVREYHRIKEYLAQHHAPLARALFNLIEAHDNRAIVERDAAYLVGVAWGKRLGRMR